MKSWSERGIDPRRTSIVEWARHYAKDLSEKPGIEIVPTQRFPRERNIGSDALEEAGVKKPAPESG